jgi:hypothetical protein
VQFIAVFFLVSVAIGECMPLRFSIAFGRSVLRMKLPLAVVAGFHTPPLTMTAAGWAAQNHVAADAAVRTGFQQLKVKVWLRSGIQIELMFSCGTNAANFARRQAGIQPVLR